MIKEYIRTGMEFFKIVICLLFGNRIFMILQLNHLMLLSCQARDGLLSNMIHHNNTLIISKDDCVIHVRLPKPNRRISHEITYL